MTIVQNEPIWLPAGHRSVAISGQRWTGRPCCRARREIIGGMPPTRVGTPARAWFSGARGSIASVGLTVELYLFFGTLGEKAEKKLVFGVAS